MSNIQTTRQPQPRELDGLLREALKQAVHRCPLNPAQIADELTKRVGRTISGDTIYAWTAATKSNWHLPADVVPYLCEILEDDSIQRLVLSDKLRNAVDLGEDIPRVVSLLRCVLGEGKNRKTIRRPRRRSKR